MPSTRWLPALSILVVFVGCSSNDSMVRPVVACDFAAKLKSRAGAGAMDCGHAALGGSASAVDACVVQAFQAGQAFYARYDRQGIDSAVVFGIAGDSSGNVIFMLRDSDPSGGSGAPPTLYENSCLDPAVDPSTSRDPFIAPPLTCTSSPSLGQTCS